MKVIVISGKAGAGKDTTAKYLKAAMEKDGKLVLIAHYGDLVKYVCRTFFGWNGKKDERGRTLLQYVGTDIVRKYDENYWVNFILQMISFFGDDFDYILIPDCRFPNEISVIKSQFDTMHIRVFRENNKRKMTPEQLKHSSETALDNVTADCEIHNNMPKYKLKRYMASLYQYIKDISEESK